MTTPTVTIPDDPTIDDRLRPHLEPKTEDHRLARDAVLNAASDIELAVRSLAANWRAVDLPTLTKLVQGLAKASRKYERMRSAAELNASLRGQARRYREAEGKARPKHDPEGTA